MPFLWQKFKHFHSVNKGLSCVCVALAQWCSSGGFSARVNTSAMNTQPSTHHTLVFLSPLFSCLWKKQRHFSPSGDLLQLKTKYHTQVITFFCFVKLLDISISPISCCNKALPCYCTTIPLIYFISLPQDAAKGSPMIDKTYHGFHLWLINQKIKDYEEQQKLEQSLRCTLFFYF